MYDTHFNVVCDLGDGTAMNISGSAVFDHEPTEDDIRKLPMMKGKVVQVAFTFHKMDGGDN